MKVKVVYPRGFKNYEGKTELVYDNLNSQHVDGLVIGSILRYSSEDHPEGKEIDVSFYQVEDKEVGGKEVGGKEVEGKEVEGKDLNIPINESEVAAKYIVGYYDDPVEDLNKQIRSEYTDRLQVMDEGSLYMYVQFNTVDFLQGFRTALHLVSPNYDLGAFVYEKNDQISKEK